MRLEDLFERRAAGIHPGIEHLRAIHRSLGSPSSGIPAIHIVGTNGKGSTAAMCEEALRRRGRRVGLYTSPHLVRVNERIRVLGEPVDDSELQAAVSRVLGHEPAAGPRGLSFFEVLTLAALLVFEEHRLDALVVEAGLGGRLDATRLVEAQAVVVTSIDLDHQQWLGDTLEEIAFEKAGVFRAGVPVFVGPVDPGPDSVLRRRATECGSPYRPVLSLAEAPPALPGDHQRSNAALAVAAAAVLDPQVVAGDAMGVRWPGRLERIDKGQGAVWLDAGHNPAAIAQVVETLGPQLDPARTCVVFGCTSDRPVDEMMSHLSVLGPTWWVPVEAGATPPSAERTFAGPDDAALLTALNERLQRGDVIVVAGSHRLVGPLRQWVLGRHTSSIDPTDPTGSPG